MAAGLEPVRAMRRFLAAPSDGRSGEEIRREVAEELERSRVRYLSTARRDRAAFLSAPTEDEIIGLAERIVDAGPHARVGVGRPASDAWAEASSRLAALDAPRLRCLVPRSRLPRALAQPPGRVAGGPSTACSGRPPTAHG